MLKKNLRLRRGDDFERVYKTGRRVTEKHLQLLFLNTGPPHISRQNPPRFGFVVSKKATPKIHERNRVKRILRALAQARLDDFNRGYDYIFQARRDINQLSNTELAREFDALIKRLRPIS